MPREDQCDIRLRSEQLRLITYRDQRTRHVTVNLPRTRDLPYRLDNLLVEADISDHGGGARRRADTDDAFPAGLKLRKQCVQVELARNNALAERSQLSFPRPTRRFLGQNALDTRQRGSLALSASVNAD